MDAIQSRNQNHRVLSPFQDSEALIKLEFEMIDANSPSNTNTDGPLRVANFQFNNLNIIGMEQTWVSMWNIQEVILLTFYETISNFNDPEKKPFENIVEKGENAGNQHFLLCPQCFHSFPKQISVFESHLFCHLQMLSI